MKETFSLVLALVAVGALLYGCWLLSRYLSKKVNQMQQTANMRLVERIALTQDKGLAIMELCDRFYLVGFSANSVEILREIDQNELKLEKSSTPGFAKFFADAMKTVKDGRKDEKPPED